MEPRQSGPKQPAQPSGGPAEAARPPRQQQRSRRPQFRLLSHSEAFPSSSNGGRSQFQILSHSEAFPSGKSRFDVNFDRLGSAGSSGGYGYDLGGARGRPLALTPNGSNDDTARSRGPDLELFCSPPTASEFPSASQFIHCVGNDARGGGRPTARSAAGASQTALRSAAGASRPASRSRGPDLELFCSPPTASEFPSASQFIHCVGNDARGGGRPMAAAGASQTAPRDARRAGKRDAAELEGQPGPTSGGGGGGDPPAPSVGGGDSGWRLGAQFDAPAGVKMAGMLFHVIYHGEAKIYALHMPDVPGIKWKHLRLEIVRILKVNRFDFLFGGAPMHKNEEDYEISSFEMEGTGRRGSPIKVIIGASSRCVWERATKGMGSFWDTGVPLHQC